MRNMQILLVALFLFGATEAHSQTKVKCIGKTTEPVVYVVSRDSTIFFDGREKHLPNLYTYTETSYPTGGFTSVDLQDARGTKYHLAPQTKKEADKYVIGQWYTMNLEDERPPAPKKSRF